jgi:hypothetical protein
VLGLRLPSQGTDFLFVSDTAQYVFERANVSAIRRVRKSDNNRIALAVGATIVNRVEDIRESDVGTECGLFNIEKMGDECVNPFLSCFLVYAFLLDTSHSLPNAKTLKHAPYFSVVHPRTSLMKSIGILQMRSVLHAMRTLTPNSRLAEAQPRWRSAWVCTRKHVA